MNSRFLLLLVVLLSTALLRGQSVPADDDAKWFSSCPTTPQLESRPTPIEVLSDTMGVDFGSYLANVLGAIRQKWYGSMPEEARPPHKKSGRVIIEFNILKDGKIDRMQGVECSGDLTLDSAARNALLSASPFHALPDQFKGPFLRLRFRFLYNPPPLKSQ